MSGVEFYEENVTFKMKLLFCESVSPMCFEC